MTDDMTARIFAQMRGDQPSTSQVREQPVDPVSQEIWDHMRGGSERNIRRERGEYNIRTHRGQASFNARVQKRAQEIVDREGPGGRFPWEGDAMPLPLDQAREQLRQEDAAAAREAEKRDVYDRMVASNRAESEANRTEALRGRIKAATEERRERHLSKFEASILAALRNESVSA
jgi:hypothetical protein